MPPPRIASVILETVWDLFFPRHCVGCGSALASGWICSSCRASVAPIAPPRCETCSHPFPGLAEEFVCENCRGRVFHFRSAVAVLPSRGYVRDLVHRLKYRHELWLAGPLGELLALAWRDARLAGQTFDGIVPVPLHPLRQRERGFNQAEILAREVVRLGKGPLLEVLRRTRDTETQTHFDRRQRMENLRDAFTLRQNATVQGKHLLLVDDVLTTGSTLDECARVLIQAGAASVCALTVARG